MFETSSSRRSIYVACAGAAYSEAAGALAAGASAAGGWDGAGGCSIRAGGLSALELLRNVKALCWLHLLATPVAMPTRPSHSRLGRAPERRHPTTPPFALAAAGSSCFNASSTARRHHTLHPDEPLPFSPLCLSPESRFGSLEERNEEARQRFVDQTGGLVWLQHTRKAGGTAMCHFLAQQGNAKAKASEMCWGLPGLSSLPQRLWPRVTQRMAEHGYDLVSSEDGHFPEFARGGMLDDGLANVTFVTVVRHPIDHLISHAVYDLDFKLRCEDRDRCADTAPMDVARLSDALLAIANGTNIAPTPVSKGCRFDNYLTRVFSSSCLKPHAAVGGCVLLFSRARAGSLDSPLLLQSTASLAAVPRVPRSDGRSRVHPHALSPPPSSTTQGGAAARAGDARVVHARLRARVAAGDAAARAVHARHALRPLRGAEEQSTARAPCTRDASPHRTHTHANADACRHLQRSREAQLRSVPLPHPADATTAAAPFLWGRCTTATRSCSRTSSRTASGRRRGARRRAATSAARRRCAARSPAGCAPRSSATSRTTSCSTSRRARSRSARSRATSSRPPTPRRAARPAWTCRFVRLRRAGRRGFGRRVVVRVQNDD